MTADDVKNRIKEICNCFQFEFKEKLCGVDPFSCEDFDMWFGEDYMKATSIEEVMGTKFFDGKALNEIVNEIKIIDW